MTVALTKGGNVSLSKQAPGLTAVRVGLGWRTEATAGTGCDLDASALLCDASGKVLSEEHFVFFNNLRSPEGAVTLAAAPNDGSGDDARIDIDLTAVPAAVTKIVFPVSLYEAETRGQSFAQVTAAHIRVTGTDGTALARYDLHGAGGAETAMVFGELYRHGAEWKFRAIGQGYASGLAGIAQDYGVDVLRPEPAAPAPAAAPPAPPAPAMPPLPPEPAAFPPAAHATVPDPASHPAPIGDTDMTCFFDPSHGPGTTPVMWSPQWGVPRQITSCPGCAQRVQTTPPPYYTAPQQGYPQAGYPQQPTQPGYPQAAPAQPGYPQPEQPQQGRRFGTGALIGAGAAGLVGGALLNEAFDDDEPDVIVNNYYED
ncbi:MULTISPECIES: TerD family protein [Streptomyces]|uniref:TerD family protein n=1 Tax=Streptomyces ramulosus TaxID=47762 RepID=A0ABW1FGY9_9ACTN